MLVVLRAARPSNILQDGCLAMMMAHRWIRCSVFYITFMPRFSFKEHMKSGAHLLVSGLAGVGGMFWGEFMLLLDMSSVWEEDAFPLSTVT